MERIIVPIYVKLTYTHVPSNGLLQKVSDVQIGHYFHRNEGADDGGDGVNKVADVQWSHLGLSVHATLPSASLCERDTKSTGTHRDIFTRLCTLRLKYNSYSIFCLHLHLG